MKHVRAGGVNFRSATTALFGECRFKAAIDEDGGVNGGRPWTEAEQEFLTSAIAQDMNFGEVALMLCRSRNAVYQRAVGSGLIQTTAQQRQKRRPFHELFGD